MLDAGSWTSKSSPFLRYVALLPCQPACTPFRNILSYPYTCWGFPLPAFPVLQKDPDVYHFKDLQSNILSKWSYWQIWDTHQFIILGMFQSVATIFLPRTNQSLWTKHNKTTTEWVLSFIITSCEVIESMSETELWLKTREWSLDCRMDPYLYQIDDGELPISRDGMN